MSDGYSLARPAFDAEHAPAVDWIRGLLGSDENELRKALEDCIASRDAERHALQDQVEELREQLRKRVETIIACRRI